GPSALAPWSAGSGRERARPRSLALAAVWPPSKQDTWASRLPVRGLKSPALGCAPAAIDHQLYHGGKRVPGSGQTNGKPARAAVEHGNQGSSRIRLGVTTVNHRQGEQHRVVTLGEALIDMVAAPGSRGGLADASTFYRAAGGAPANVAVGAARLGARAGFV